MKIDKRKLKISLLFLVCWFAVLTFIIDGLGQFPNILNFFGGSVIVTEVVLWLMVIIPPAMVYCFVKGANKS